MKKKVFFSFLFVTLFTIVLSASEKSVSVNDEVKDGTVSFAAAFHDSPQYGLVEKMQDNGGGDSEKWAKASNAMFWVGVAGAITAGVSLLLLIAGAVLYGVAWDIYYRPYNYVNSNMTLTWDQYWGMWSAGQALIGVGAAFLVLGIIATVVGFVLWYVFGKKAGTISMYMENRQSIVTTDTPFSPARTSPAIGLKFSF